MVAKAKTDPAVGIYPCHDGRCFTLLSTGSDWFASTGETTIHVGDQLVEPESEAWHRLLKPRGAVPRWHLIWGTFVWHQRVTAAWGALYWHNEEMDKIVKTDGSLDMRKQLFVEEVTSTGAL